jgi:cytochrome c biogenesis protein ResB
VKSPDLLPPHLAPPRPWADAIKAIYHFLKSPRLAVVVILVIASLSLLATLVPQRLSDAWYQAHYGAVAYGLISALGMEGFFRSVLFLAPVCLFTVNLGVCAVDRFVGRVRRGAPNRFGPDLVHIGLLVLIAGGLVTGLGRQEQSWTLAAGDVADLTPAYSITLVSLESKLYENGSPKEWTSTVKVMHDGKEELSAYPVQVNHPLRLHGLSVYQADWGIDGTLQLADPEGKLISPPPSPGDWFEDGGTRWVFMRFQKDGAWWQVSWSQYRGGEVVSTRTLGMGQTIGPFTVRGIDAHEVTGLKAVRDPGYAPFLAALVLVMAGLALTFFQKRGENAT